MLAKYTRVRARSENEGSGIEGRLPAAPLPPCCRLDEDEDIVDLFNEANHGV
jgi:hypothetical protein